MKILDSRTKNASHPVMKGWSLKLLSTVVLGCMASSAGHTSDLEIYQGATYGNASIMMMLDNSGSMNYNSISKDYPSATFRSGLFNEKIKEDIYSDDGSRVVDSVQYQVDFYRSYYDYNVKYYDRMSRLKMALVPMFANPKSDNAFGRDVDISKYKIGLGTFFLKQFAEGGGEIQEPVKELTLANRKKLINRVIALKSETNTPTAHAYAEAGAYMLGTRTYKLENEARYIEAGYYVKDGSKYDLYECKGTSSNLNTAAGFKRYECNQGYNRRQNNVKYNELNPSYYLGIGSSDYTYVVSNGGYYYKKVTKDWTDYSYSGFDLSADNTKKQPNGSTYQSPIPDEATQCDGYGVYFLTDGEPNNTFNQQDTRDLMNTSLETGSVLMSRTCSSGLTSRGSLFENNTSNGKPAWECIGEYAKALYSKDNPKETIIATATVGFGSVFKELIGQGKVTKAITRPSGAVETAQVYQCDHRNVSSQDAKNVCKLGEKGEGYGEGGFYYTEESVDIANSVRKFIEDVSKAEIDPISAGTMSVPLDSLGGLKSRQFAYLPILEPIPKSPLLWNGNLKKYKVQNNTLKGSDGKFVFSDNTGLFAKNTHDLWNTLDGTRPDAQRPDRGEPQVGGAYQQVFENASGNTIGDRNLFVDSGGSLINLKVSSDNKPVNFDTLMETEESNKKKRALLHFMGYSEPETTTVKDGVKISATKNKWLKNIGGVLHSIPQLITQKVNVDASGQFDQSSRKDYIIYGSMDGALHMLDDSTGKETFTFIPKQILDLQPDALTSNGTAKDGSYPYGVDAPWLTYVSYTTKSTTTDEGEAATTTNTYESDQSFALGGLRMGGSMYYALDVSDVNAPKIIYGVGSNYANRQKGDTTTLGGTINNATSTATIGSPEQKAFAKMGQSWGKPTLGYVKSDGKKVMVSFLPGGYDTCYEDPKFKLNTSYPTDTQCDNKPSAQGNAVYMVQMGEVETQSNKEEKVNTAKNNGKLLWWANNQGSGDGSTSRSTSLQYSKSADLKHSVVTQIRALDRNYDGLIDHIYFADLGGQVWRVDINNNNETNSFKVDRVVKVLDVSDQADTGDAPPRFYERPLITFYNGKNSYKDASGNSGSYNGVQTMITVGTGDRSNPVTAERSKPDALYSVMDKDLAREDLFYYRATGTAPVISLRTPVIKVPGLITDSNKLQELKFANADIGANGIKKRMQGNVIQGWYMPFTKWLGNGAAVGGKYKIKMFNEPDAIAGVLISSSFNPDEGQEIKACSAGVRGSTQRERTCLPYGACLDASGNDVLTARSTFNAGSGIVDNIITQYNDTNIFGSLVNRCEGDDCQPKLICPNGNCQPVPPTCTGPDCGVNSGINVDKRLNPLSWMEH
ncbi:hypothetical protein [Psychrobacter sp. DAB_AL32B]|uniref:hypothetical protein n=1 Tax=Psychrobacter sp. DAB_AL32B TaxID=1028414 RepID=UPI000F5055A8|nr:hypothetical protein [Psychrobacter sp. DAB_AL32B]